MLIARFGASWLAWPLESVTVRKDEVVAVGVGSSMHEHYHRSEGVRIVARQSIHTEAEEATTA